MIAHCAPEVVSDPSVPCRDWVPFSGDTEVCHRQCEVTVVSTIIVPWVLLVKGPRVKSFRCPSIKWDVWVRVYSGRRPWESSVKLPLSLSLPPSSFPSVAPPSTPLSFLSSLPLPGPPSFSKQGSRQRVSGEGDLVGG